MAFEVLMLSEGMKVIGERIESRAILHRLWLEPDIEAALARIAPNIRAIAATWHAPKIEASLMARPSWLRQALSGAVVCRGATAEWENSHDT